MIDITSYSMTIGGKHTYRDWGMIPKSIPVFAPPIPKTNYIDVPFSDGALDYSEINRPIAYNNRQGSFEFLVLDKKKWPIAYSEIMMHLQGRKLNCVLDDDPEYYYTGRFSVNEWRSRDGASSIVIDYNVEPYKHKIEKASDHDWLWNDLFDTIIYYGTFDVNGSKIRNLINPVRLVQQPVFTCSSSMFVDFNGTVYTLPRGKTTRSGILLQTNNNIMTFRGNGRVIVDYDTGASL